MGKARSKTAFIISAVLFVMASCVPSLTVLGIDPLFKCNTIADCAIFPSCDFVLCVDGGCACQNDNVTNTKCKVDGDCNRVGEQFCSLEGAVCRDAKCICAPDLWYGLLARAHQDDGGDVVSCSKKIDCAKVNVLCQPGTTLDCVNGECKCVYSN